MNEIDKVEMIVADIQSAIENKRVYNIANIENIFRDIVNFISKEIKIIIFVGV